MFIASWHEAQARDLRNMFRIFSLFKKDICMTTDESRNSIFRKQEERSPFPQGKAATALNLGLRATLTIASSDAVLGAECLLKRHLLVCNLRLICSNKLKPNVIGGKIK